MIYRAMIPPSVNRGEGATTEPDTDKQKDLTEGSYDLDFWREKNIEKVRGSSVKFNRELQVRKKNKKILQSGTII